LKVIILLNNQTPSTDVQFLISLSGLPGAASLV